MCGGKKVTRRYHTYHCERCPLYFRGKKISFWPFVVRIAFTPEDNWRRNIQPKGPCGLEEGVKPPTY